MDPRRSPAVYGADSSALAPPHAAGYCGAMSEENVEAVRALLAAFEQRDFEAVVEFLDPLVGVRPAIVGGPEGVVYRGPRNEAVLGRHRCRVGGVPNQARRVPKP